MATISALAQANQFPAATTVVDPVLYQAIQDLITANNNGTGGKLTLTQPATSATLTILNGTTITGPAATDTIVGRASTDTLTNKTLTAPAVTGLAQDVGAALSGAGTTRTDATALTKTVNQVTTAASGTGVILPTLGIGNIIYVFNAGANPLQVYGAGSATIDGVAGSTGVPLANAKRAAFFAVAANTWISAQLGVVSA